MTTEKGEERSDEDRKTRRYLLRKDTAVLLGLAALTFLLHIVASAFTDYGYFIDELYYIACSKRLAFGYVDHPPLSILLLAANRAILGDSLPALRFLPALAGGGTVFLTGLIARRLGGGTAAQSIAALAVLIAPGYLIFCGFYSMNPFEFLIWTAVTIVLVKMIQEEKPALWMIVGLLLGIGLEMKHTMILYAVGLGMGMLVTSARRWIWNRWFFYGVLIAFTLLLPNILWQFYHGFPSLEFYRNAMFYKNIPTNPLGVLIGQVLITNPLTVPLWVGGLLFLFLAEDGKRYRFFGWCFVILVLSMVLSQSSRPDRIMSVYPVLFSAGAVALERFSRSTKRRWPVNTAATLLVFGGLFLMPISVPLLPPSSLVRYMNAIGFSMNLERGKSAPLPQWFADRFGWRELAEEVSEVYHRLPPELRQTCVIITGSYGQAGALEFFGSRYGLPLVYSTHNSYHTWGPPPDSAGTYIGVMVSKRDLDPFFNNVVVAGTFSCDYCMNYERNIPIYVARSPKIPVSEVWPRVKHYE